MLKQTTVYNVSLHLHAKFQKRHEKFVLYLPSALSKVTTRSLLCNERMLSTRVSNVASASLKRAPVGGCRFRPMFGTYEIHIFYFGIFSLFIYSGRVGSRLVTL